jgi:hypothetical protein
MRISILILSIVLCLVACNDAIPATVIPADEMGTIIFEINMAEEFVNSYVAKDTLKNKNAEINKEYQKIFLMHEVTEKQFKESYDFYKTHTDIYKSLMDSVNARAQRRRTELYQTHGS